MSAVNAGHTSDPSGKRDAAVGDEMYRLVRELYPICRSITGSGVRDTLAVLQREIPLTLHEVPTGTQVLDWTIPQEWNIRDAYIKNAHGERVVDFRRSNLHVVQYSEPVRRWMSREELASHLFTIPERPSWIPYRTSYYTRTWGFCLSENRLSQLTDDEYEVCIDSSLADGYLTYAECYLAGERQDEVLISSHICHPSLCNDNLSGIALATVLAKHFGSKKRRFSYRFVFTPATIGSIAWLSANRHHVERVQHGLVLACVGDPGNITYKRSRIGNATIDRAVAHVLRHSGAPHQIVDFSPYGYDERQYCSPGFDLPVGCLMRTPHGQFPEYHTSADDLDFVRPRFLNDSFTTCASALEVVEGNRTYLNLNPHGEPQLGRRGLYSAMGGHSEPRRFQLALLWVLNLSDGHTPLLDIAERADMPFTIVRDAALALERAHLLQEVSASAEAVKVSSV